MQSQLWAGGGKRGVLDWSHEPVNGGHALSMLRSLEVENFRGMRRLKVRGLQRVNVVTGPNGVGKTSLLEALWLYSGPNNPELVMRLYGMRSRDTGVQFAPGVAPREVVENLFTDFDTGCEVVLTGTERTGGIGTVRLRIPAMNMAEDTVQLGEQTMDGVGTTAPVRQSVLIEVEERLGSEPAQNASIAFKSDGTVEMKGARQATRNGVFVSTAIRGRGKEDARRLGGIQVQRREHGLINALRVIEPQLKALTVVPGHDDKLSVYADTGGDRMVPLWLLGDGAIHLASIVLAMSDASGGLLLVDEIENGIYYETLEPMWRAIHMAATEFDVQVVATSHSRECVVAAHRAFSAMERYDFALCRLERTKARQLRAMTYTREQLEDSLEAGFEVR